MDIRLMSIPPRLYLWRVTIRPLNVGKMGEEWAIHVGHRSSCSLREVSADVRSQYTDEWWETHLITNIELIGKLHRVDGEALYEKED